MYLWKFCLILVHLVVSIAARAQGDLYKSDDNIYELSPSNFDKVVQKTNYTSIVKFYAPWCGYCKQLEPAYHKLAKLIHNDGQYAINVASVNCDEDKNKELCARYKISGFPTLMVFRPPKYDSKKKSRVYSHAVEPYNGERSLKSMYTFLTSRIKNYVKKFPNLQSEGLKDWLLDNKENNKVLLLTESKQISPLYKSLAIDFINTLKFGMVTVKSPEDVNNFKIEINGKEIISPIGPDDRLPILLNFDETTQEFSKYKSEKLSDKVKISEWLIESNNIQPLEGILSKKDKKYYSNYRKGKKAKKVVHDEL
ncbi:uncharacterized protein AC631_04495 [Debaryomyces fabryi]|uniref:Thioredoxin domain-containing protein n=1 Tax=Debaryomyces fabryi TaxID=58627 RepID=A0A0V1PU23_9ASCO|nr:uncharacterized protein AC631_04495 [Debaryomyces fabryi]KRZ99728.1 hypothetical protein AC631_04495 [Debaryomyces fabryi]CUM54371.1 unnamed protein product [Debaryomyces fabryi]